MHAVKLDKAHMEAYDRSDGKRKVSLESLLKIVITFQNYITEKRFWVSRYQSPNFHFQLHIFKEEAN